MSIAPPGYQLSEQRLAKERKAGKWPDRILTGYLDQHLRTQADATAFIGLQCETGETLRLTLAELAEYSIRIAANLQKLGVKPGDVVSFQLPNWWQFVALHLACLRLGAISNPLMPIFRERELRFMLRFAESKVLIVPKTFRNFDHRALANKLSRELESLKQVFAIGVSGPDSFEDNLLKQNNTLIPYTAAPNDVIQLLYTSGTTGEPKGVLHTSNTLLSNLIPFVERLHIGADDVVFMPSPFAHQTGFTYGMTLALMLGIPLVAADVWNPAQAAQLIEQYGVTYLFAATPFMADLAYLPDIKRFNLDKFRVFVTAGAPIPPSLVAATKENLGVHVIAGWGMTECGLTTMTYPDGERVTDSDNGVLSRQNTDGIALPGEEVRVIDEQGNELPRGEEGQLQIRGSALFVGYLKRPQLYDVDAAGWFNTGDIARMDESAYIRLIGRSKDIIIRGGENIPVIEVENLIHEMAQVADVAIVAMPDERLGEKACAFITLHPERSLTFADLIAFLQQHHLAKQYLPEYLEIIAEMPRTASGKIQKFVLRERAKTLARQS